jgi:hypothetical protein
MTPRRYARLQVQLDPDLLLFAAQAEHRLDLAKDRGHVERLGAQLELAGLDPRHVEQVFQDRQQGRGGGARGLGEGALVVVERGLGEQLKHAEHAVHRGAQLVTDDGDDRALGLIGGASLVACHPQLLNREAAASIPYGRDREHQRRDPRDVAGDRHGVGGQGGRVVQAHARQEDPGGEGGGEEQPEHGVAAAQGGEGEQAGDGRPEDGGRVDASLGDDRHGHEAEGEQDDEVARDIEARRAAHQPEKGHGAKNAGEVLRDGGDRVGVAGDAHEGCKREAGDADPAHRHLGARAVANQWVGAEVHRVHPAIEPLVDGAGGGQRIGHYAEPLATTKPVTRWSVHHSQVLRIGVRRRVRSPLSARARAVVAPRLTPAVHQGRRPHGPLRRLRRSHDHWPRGAPA